MTPYSARVVIRTTARYREDGRMGGRQRNSCPPALLPSSARHSVLPTRHPDLRHLSQIEHVVNLVGREDLVAFHEVANEHALLHRLLADFGGTGVADLRGERRGERGRALDPILAHVALPPDYTPT